MYLTASKIFPIVQGSDLAIKDRAGRIAGGSMALNAAHTATPQQQKKNRIDILGISNEY
jgi:hypothetical protein